MVWHLLITLLVALTILGIRKIKLHGEREQLQTLFLLPYPVISQHISKQCPSTPWMILSKTDELRDSAWCLLLFPCPYVCGLLIVTFLPFLFIISPTLILLIPAFFFSVFPLATGHGFHGKTFSWDMNLSIRKRLNRITRC